MEDVIGVHESLAKAAAFMGLWCADCKADRAYQDDPDNADGCPIIAATMALRVSDPDYPPEWRYSAKGQPECTAFEAADTSRENDLARDEPLLPSPLEDCE